MVTLTPVYPASLRNIRGEFTAVPHITVYDKWDINSMEEKTLAGRNSHIHQGKIHVCSRIDFLTYIRC